jgi:hypothetical protein
MVKGRKTTRKRGGQATPSVSKAQVIQDPVIKDALKAYVAQKGGRQVGAGWWEDFTGWLRKNKVISTASRIGSAVAGAVGYLPLSTALTAVEKGSSSLGYGRRRFGGMYAQSIAMPSASSQTPFMKW